MARGNILPSLFSPLVFSCTQLHPQILLIVGMESECKMSQIDLYRSSEVLDAYLPVVYEALLIKAFKLIFAFGVSYEIVPWILLDGFRGAFSTMAGIHFAIMLLAVPLWYYGKQIRQNLWLGSWLFIN
jgi:hypothetical protein